MHFNVRLKTLKLGLIVNCILGCVIISLLYLLGVRWLYPNLVDAGAFGDSFGALNATLAGFGFFLIAYSLFQQKEALLKQGKAIEQTQTTLDLQREQVEMQSKELKLQREELAATRDELKRSAKAHEESTRALEQQLRVSNLSSQVEVLKVLMDDEIEHIKHVHKDLVSEGFEYWVPGGLQQRAKALSEQEDRQGTSDKKCAIRNLRTLAQQKIDIEKIYKELRKTI